MIEKLRKQIEDSYYWDARVKVLNCNYFGDEVKLVFEDNDGDITYLFEKCYKVHIEHFFEYSKVVPSRELSFAQIPYFMQNVEVNTILLENKRYLEFEINMYPIDLYIVCMKFNIC